MSITPSHHWVVFSTDETLEEANIRLNYVVSEYMGTIVQLKKEISYLRDVIDQYKAKLRAMVSTKMIKEEPLDPVACVKEEPESDDGELCCVLVTYEKGQPHADDQYSTSTPKQAKQEIKEEPQTMGKYRSS